MTNKQPQIHPQMTIEQILGSFPSKAQRLAQELTNQGLHCVGCGAATWETLEAGVLGHGLSIDTLNKLVERLNAIVAEEEDLTTVTLTEKAADKYQQILEEEGKQEWSLRFGEQMAGCSGFEYTLDFSENANPDDTVFESRGIQIHVNNAMVPRLIGCVIDYVDGLQNAGFKISNPNVHSACGCGSSHGY